MKYKVKKPLLQKIGKQAEESIEGYYPSKFNKKWARFYSIRKIFTYLTTLYTTLQKSSIKNHFLMFFYLQVKEL